VHELGNEQQLLRARFAEDLRENPTELRFFGNAPERHWRIYRVSVATRILGISAFAAYQKTAGHSLINRWQASLGVRKEL
jgi:hypothetical protein